jgi:hypothetical protein
VKKGKKGNMKTSISFCASIVSVLIFSAVAQAGKQPTTTPATNNPCSCSLAYPFTSANPRTSVIFNESEVLRGFSPKCVVSNGAIMVWYSDEHALTLGIRNLTIKTKAGVTNHSYEVSPMSNPTEPCSVTNVNVGLTSPDAIVGGTDPSGRPIWPALFFTDITDQTNSTSGDWQNGGDGIPPQAVFGTWKAAVKVVDYTESPPVVTVMPDADPYKNGWSLASGSDPVPSGLASEGYCTEVRWNVSELVAEGVLQANRSYRFQFMVHDGDQNKSGGDVGQGCANMFVSSPPSGHRPPPPQ